MPNPGVNQSEPINDARCPFLEEAVHVLQRLRSALVADGGVHPEVGFGRQADGLHLAAQAGRYGPQRVPPKDWFLGLHQGHIPGPEHCVPCNHKLIIYR